VGGAPEPVPAARAAVDHRPRCLEREQAEERYQGERQADEQEEDREVRR
jgi:hypothetical protein